MPGDLPVASTPESLEFAKIQDQHAFDFAMRNLELTAQDNRENRENFSKYKKAMFIIALAIIIGISIFFISALFLGKDALLIDLLKIIAGAFGGSGIGYIYGFRRGAHQNH